MKELSIEEVGLLTEMKDRCLNKGLYTDENAKKKFEMLCHLEDFSIQYYELQNNWNELKYYFKKQTIELEKVREDISMDTYINRKMFLKEVLDKMQEMEQVK